VASGCRFSEARALTPGDVDRVNGTVLAPSDWVTRPTNRTPDAIRQYSASIGVHPGIVVGRMQYEMGNYRWGNGLKQTVYISEGED
jgi:hypothetical protein